MSQAHRPRVPATWWVATVAVIATAAALLALLPWWATLALAGLHAWFWWHGVAVTRRALGDDRTAVPWLIGPVIGLGLCTLGLLVLWVLGARGWWMFVLAPWPAWLVQLVPRRRVTPAWRLFAADRRDAAAVLLLVMLVPLIVGVPYARVGAALPDGGRAYRAYFTADFVWAMTTVAEVSKGDVPPRNPFLRESTLRYYWLAHFLSAATYRVGAGWDLRIEPVILASSVGYGVAFVLFLFAFARAWGAGPLASATAIVIVFLANSFEGLDRIVAWWSHGDLWARLVDINIDAVTRWFYQAMPVDGLHRMLLYQPHHLTGYAFGLLALLVVGRREDVGGPAVAALAGSLLAVCLLYSSFIAIILGAAVGLVYGVRLLAERRWAAMVPCALAGAIPVAAAVWASVALGYVDPAAGSLLQFGPNRVAFRHPLFSLLLSLGPLLLLGLGGSLLALGRRREALPLLALVCTALGFYFFADVPDMQGVWVGWRAGHLLFIAFTALAAVLFSWVGRQRPALRWPVWLGTGGLVLAALPTVVIDVHNAQDLSNRGEGPGFPWVLRLGRGEVEALAWVRRATAPWAVVQVDTLTRDNASWGYMTGFGERRMAAGLPIAMIPLTPYERATRRVHDRVFRDPDAAAAGEAARRHGIDYVYLGPVEQRTHRGIVDRYEAAPDHFEPVFRNDDVVIFRVVERPRP